MQNTSVTISGLGAVTGYGWGRKYLWEGVTSGEPAAQLTPGFGEVLRDDAAWLALVPEIGEDGRSRFTRAVQAAVREAVEDATDRGWRPGEMVGVVHAIVLGEVELWRDFYLVHGMRRSRKQFIELMPSTPLTAIMREHGFHGPCMGVMAMCASGNAGLLTAKQWIDAGVATDVVVVATDISVTPHHLRPFVDLGVCIVDRPPLDACRPFQQGSGGFSVGEASVATVVSGSPAGGYARILGGALTHDGHHAISIAPGHPEVRRCWTTALASAGVRGEEVAYLNAHGPGTRQCDTTEAELFDELLPNAAGLYSFKPLTGHCQGAAALVEVAVSCMAYETGWIPAPPQVAPGHPRLVSGLTRREPGPTVKSSIGMGGNNSMIVLDEPLEVAH